MRQGRPGCSSATQGVAHVAKPITNTTQRGGERGHVPPLKMAANLESKGGGTLGELDVLRVIGSIAAAQVGTAERRGLRIQQTSTTPGRVDNNKSPVLGEGGREEG